MSADVHCRLGSELGFRVTAGQSARWNRLASSGHSAVTVSDTDNTVRIKPALADFTKVSDMLGVSPGELESEWRIVRRLEGNLSTQDNLIMLATSPEKCAMFPAFSSTIYKLNCCQYRHC